jgi:uncharacterized membrane protein
MILLLYLSIQWYLFLNSVHILVGLFIETCDIIDDDKNDDDNKKYSTTTSLILESPVVTLCATCFNSP